MKKIRNEITEIVEKLTKLSNELYDSLPVGEINAFDLTTVIKNHKIKLDQFIEELEKKLKSK